MDVILHFDGLPKGRKTWFNNRRGATVFIGPGEWAIIDTEKNPFWENWIKDGVAHRADQIPDSVDFLYENSDPQGPKIPPPWGDEPPPRGTFALYGPILDPEALQLPDGTQVTVLNLSAEEIERLRLRLMPEEIPGFALTDARRDKRGAKFAHTLPAPWEGNFFPLIRLAWLSCRHEVERAIAADMRDWEAYQKRVRNLGLPEDPVRRPSRPEVRRRIEEATAKVLSEWGVLRGSRLPDRTTIFREMKAQMLTVDTVDRFLLRMWSETRTPQSEPPQNPL